MANQPIWSVRAGCLASEGTGIFSPVRELDVPEKSSDDTKATFHHRCHFDENDRHQISMNVLVAQGRPPYPLRLGGAARVTHRLLQGLSAISGVHVSWMGRLRSMNQPWGAGLSAQDRRVLGVRSVTNTVTGTTFDVGYPSIATMDFWQHVLSRLESDRPSLLVATLENASHLALQSRQRGIPAMIYIMDAEYPSSEIRCAAQKGVNIVCLSHFLASHVKSTTGCHADVLYPIVDAVGPTNPSSLNRERAYVLMINAYAQKGVHTFLSFATLLPHIQFVLQESWPLNQTSVMWLRHRLKDLPNVTFQRAVADMSPVYANASLLVVPSVWQEGFGMVAVEAQAAGVPVIASNRGGLPESVGSGGILIDDYENPNEWARTIRELLGDSSRYARIAAEAARSTQRPGFSEHAVVEQFFRICST